MKSIFTTLFFSGLLIILNIINTNAQIQVQPGSQTPYTPEALLSNVFLGEGVKVLSVKHTGKAESVGYFSGAKNDINLDRGMVMTTGLANGTANGFKGITGKNTTPSFGKDHGFDYKDPDLDILTSGKSYGDASIYEIMFVPYTDSIKFNYSFASEEYPEFSCEPYNDVFAFIISGPGISGPFSNAGKNIALIPGTSSIVSINNIHPEYQTTCAGKNDQYYHDNTNGQAFQYDGYLDVFAAESKVNPCDTYRIKLIIADVKDKLYDSGVFLEAKSFGAGLIHVDPSTVSVDGNIVRGCKPGAFVVSLNHPRSSDYTVDIALGGSAVNGLDYQFVNTSAIIIPAGQTSVSIPVVPIDNGLPNPDKQVMLDIQIVPCKRDTFYMGIKDNILVKPDLPYRYQFCEGDTIHLNGKPNMVLPDPVTFTNSTKTQIVTIDQNAPFDPSLQPTVSSINASGIQPLILAPGVIKSVCIDIAHPWISDIDVLLASPGGQVLELTTGNGTDCSDYYNTCFTPEANKSITFNNGNHCIFGVRAPFDGEFKPEGVWSDLWDGKNPSNGSWKLITKSNNPGFTGNLNSWSITFNPIYKLAYDWTPAGNLDCATCPTTVLTGKNAGVYYLKVSDIYGCEATDSVIIDLIPKSDLVSITAVPSQNGASFSWSAVPGASQYEVNINGKGWVSPSPGPLSHVVTGLAPGTLINFELRYAGTCTVGYTSCVTLGCTPPVLTLDSKKDESCFGAKDGAFKIVAQGGVAPYTFDNGFSQNNTGDFSGLAPGNYTVTVTDNVLCSDSIKIEIVAAPKINLAINIVKPIDCAGTSSADIEAVASGGTGTLSFVWSTGQTGATLGGIFAGTYIVTVTDQNLCTAIDSIALKAPEKINLVIQVDPVKCFGASTGTITLNVTGGTPTYSYDWTGTGTVNGVKDQTKLGAGTYNVTVTDAAGCTITGMARITQPAQPLTATVTQQDTICQSGDNGILNASASGGTAPYPKYEWDNGKTGTQITNLTDGTYRLIVSDLVGCKDTVDWTMITYSIPVFDITGVDPSCHDRSDGTAEITKITIDGISHSTSEFTYKWNTNPVQTNPKAVNLSPDIAYTVEITGQKNCVYTKTITLNNPDALALTNINVTNVSCAQSKDGSISFDVTGGTNPYTYQWNPALPGGAVNLNAGSYDVTVTDSRGCTANSSFTITEPSPILSNGTVTNSCFGAETGSITLSPTGGQVPYSYLWSNGKTDATLADLGTDTYYVTVTDDNGCTQVDTFDVINIGEPLVYDVVTENITCFGKKDGKISVSVTSGSNPVNISLNGLTQVDSAKFTQLDAGSYTLIFTDKNGCRDTSDVYTITQQGSSFTVDLGGNQKIDIGDSIYLQPIVTGGTGPFTYQWLPQDTTLYSCGNCPTTFLYPETSGTYSLVVTDLAGCSVIGQISILLSNVLKVFVPNVFSPNEDNINDVLAVFAKSGIRLGTFRVFSRWGELVFEKEGITANDEKQGWDGTFKGQPVNTGVYVWTLEVVLPDGSSTILRGNTTLLK